MPEHFRELPEVKQVNIITLIQIGFDLDDLELIDELGGDYWAAARQFVYALLERDYHELSSRQIQWAMDIKDKLTKAGFERQNTPFVVTHRQKKGAKRGR